MLLGVGEGLPPRLARQYHSYGNLREYTIHLAAPKTDVHT